MDYCLQSKRSAIIALLSWDHEISLTVTLLLYVCENGHQVDLFKKLPALKMPGNHCHILGARKLFQHHRLLSWKQGSTSHCILVALPDWEKVGYFTYKGLLWDKRLALIRLHDTWQQWKKWFHVAETNIWSNILKQLLPLINLCGSLPLFWTPFKFGQRFFLRVTEAAEEIFE